MAEAFLHVNSNQGCRLLPRSNPSRSSTSYKPMRISMSQNGQYLASINADIEAHLKQAIPLRPPLSVFEPMHHLTFAAPRSTAPALCIAACELVGGHRDQAMAAALALHLNSAAAFSHEHLPLTDRPKPNSRPVIHHAYAPNIELLMGDGIFPFGYEILARSGGPAQTNSEQILRVIIEIARAMGSQGLVEGQYHETELRSNGRETNEIGLINRVVEKKEGELHACGAACGAILGGGNEEEIKKLRRYGFYVGLIRGLKAYENGEVEEQVKRTGAEIKQLAIKDLEYFKGKNMDEICSFLDI